MEITCLNWAHALLEMVYAFIDEQSEAKGSGKSKAIEIPNMRFVHAGLAIEQVQLGAEGAEARCFLLEEVISDLEKGHSFRKYLNNTSAKPCGIKNADDIQRAEFLAFVQHVQYFKTKKRAYVADFQGMSIIQTWSRIVLSWQLTKMQVEMNSLQILKSSQMGNESFVILTEFPETWLHSRKLGFIFADGNMPGTFANFEGDHICKHFCKCFGLLATYGEDYDLKDNSGLDNSDTNIQV